jgi:hypothetical protein
MRLAANVGLFYLIVRGVWLRSYTVRSLEGRASWRWRRGHRGGGGEGIVAVEARASWQWRRGHRGSGDDGDLVDVEEGRRQARVS